MLIATSIRDKLRGKTPFLWLNDGIGGLLSEDAPSVMRVVEAEQRMRRCAPVLEALFPELRDTGGLIESLLVPAEALKTEPGFRNIQGSLFVKRDDLLPIAGSIKARGGFHEVLAVAERIAQAHGIELNEASSLGLLSDEARRLFSQHSISVGSTGNLGLSIGVIAASLGFDAVVHMSKEAKTWKKERLKNRGVRVVEHKGDYAVAVAEGRKHAQENIKYHFVDDEHSELLFYGYAASARYLAQQLAEAGRVVDRDHPLFIYIPCGVGGAPGGITYGLKALFGECVHCFFAEPVASPSMLVQLAASGSQPLSVYDIGLDNQTEADGLAVGQASPLVSPVMRSLLSGVFTVSDKALYYYLQAAESSLGIELEPSAAAAFGGPQWICASPTGQRYLSANSLHLDESTHVVWSTGGSLVPPTEYLKFEERARELGAAPDDVDS